MCKSLKRTFEAKRSQYVEARSAAFYQVSSELAAYKNVNMQRAKNDLEEHQSVCASKTVDTVPGFPTIRPLT
jgi:hypothetical protein